MEEVLEFKEVLENKKVTLVATRFRGRAAAWWQQTKLTRVQKGKKKLELWEKLKKHMQAMFLPHNYTRLMYQKLQSLTKGNSSVEKYTT